MLTLITGVPGSGKTAGAVDLILREFKDRPLFVDGLNDLQLDHFPVDVLEWHKEVPDGALVVVDEVQRKWRPRSAGSKVPESVAALETHRHKGLDFILITQNPRLLDTNVRALIGRHVHIRDTGFMGRWAYEWPECNTELAWSKCQNKRRYKLPKRVFDLYKSASIHTKPVRKIPMVVYFLAVVLVLAGIFGFNVWNRFQKSEVEAMPAALVKSPEASSGNAQLAPQQAPSSMAPDERVDFLPRLSDRPWTAPAYDTLRMVVRMPVIAGSICNGVRCVCVSAQGEILEVSDSACRDWSTRKPFDPYTLPPPPSTGVPVGTALASSGAPGADTGAALSASESSRPGVDGVSNPLLEHHRDEKGVGALDLYRMQVVQKSRGVNALPNSGTREIIESFPR